MVRNTTETMWLGLDPDLDRPAVTDIWGQLVKYGWVILKIMINFVKCDNVFSYVEKYSFFNAYWSEVFKKC